MVRKPVKVRATKATKAAEEEVSSLPPSPPPPDIDQLWLEEHLPSALQGKRFTIKAATMTSTDYEGKGHVIAHLRSAGGTEESRIRPPVTHFDAEGEDIIVVMPDGAEHRLNLAALDLLTCCDFILARRGAITYYATSARNAHTAGRLEIIALDPEVAEQ